MEGAVPRHHLGTLYLQPKRLAFAESELTGAFALMGAAVRERSPY
jgi:hypothetical protein